MSLPLREYSIYDGKDLNGSGRVNYFNWGEPSFDFSYVAHQWSARRLRIDRINPKGPGGRRAVGPLDDYSIRLTGLHPFTWGVIEGYNDGGAHGYTINEGHPNRNGLIPSSQEVIDTVAQLPQGPVHNLCIAASNKFIQQVPTAVSILNFLIELKDFKEFASGLRELLKLISHKGPKNLKELLKGSGKALNSAYLEQNFNIAPFLSDIAKLINIVSTVDNRLKFLKDTRGRNVQVHFLRQDIVDRFPDFVRTFSSSYPGSRLSSICANGHVDLVLDSYSINFSATCTLYQNLIGLDDGLAFWRGLWAALGVNNPAKVVWNALPFSFMLDWLGPIGECLDKLAAQPFTGAWDIFDTSHSLRTAATFIIRAHLEPGNDYYRDHGPVDLGRAVVARKQRKVGLNLSLSDFDLQDPTDQQRSLFFSILAQKTLFKGKH